MKRPGKLWPEESELIQLVREAQCGGPGGLDTLLARLRPSFVAYCAPTMGRDDAEDAAQLTLLSLVRALPTIDPKRAPGYVLAAASHRREHARRRRATAARRFAPLELAEDVEWPVAADWDTDYHDLTQALRATLAALPRERRDALLESLHGVPSSTLAAQQRVSRATVRSRRRRARKSLHAALAALR
jgi:RNA polymerase sigma factor (sigma-70 family)